ncbi:hypothetical protein BAUCODRAFT_494959 [Baudoinia panamericana UAMH 10762]|uniref:Uncharacterized protein n=1 Tax=Baudoinia panamericana (strain UAMH 10762) TaxID=717646 RepID=M2N932_BAUPA|nr:uncharacterized protein BAUCODRAFT_494959 [Baudoinia panamericana UAMH 10762]EMC95594.1 hypothetical protein BAUCODRAFT_494959 [Baudoinia panamericana UAMH 10762]
MARDMDETVEASSLSTITAIASDPPSHPNAPLPVERPLVLYIARVPGSQDVFLTPLKPRDKIVSAEDVHSSLYYLHINLEDEQQAPEPRRPSSSRSDVAGSSTTTEDPNTIRRRPLHAPQSSSPYSPSFLSQDEDQPPFQKPRPLSQASIQHIPRKPLLRDITNEQTPPLVPPHVNLPSILPRPRPLPTPPDDRTMYLLTVERPATDNNDASTSTLGSLTLIRRDPASGAQWNVACIYDPPIHEVTSTALLSPGSAANKTKRSGAPLYLDITNPGYSQFISTPDRSASRTSTSTRSSTTSDDASVTAPTGTFRRRLYLPGSRYGEHGYGHRKVGSDEHPAPSRRERTLSDLTGRRRETPTSDKRSKNYTFASPWDGQCEFSTTATGKALKCRHYLVPNNYSGGVEVSELRFNLPTSTSTPKKDGTSTPTLPNSEKRTSYFSRHSRHNGDHEGEGDIDAPPTPTILLDSQGRVDLTLGREKAGGGFGGKRAKLGKLIIEPAGIGMLDLLVAANVGLWWRAYERVQ